MSDMEWQGAHIQRGPNMKADMERMKNKKPEPTPMPSKPTETQMRRKRSGRERPTRMRQ